MRLTRSEAAKNREARKRWRKRWDRSLVAGKNDYRMDATYYRRLFYGAWESRGAESEGHYHQRWFDEFLESPFYLAVLARHPEYRPVLYSDLAQQRLKCSESERHEVTKA